jgi:hypothetical protein
MIYGDMTISSKPCRDDMKCGICLGCLEESEEVGIDDSFDDQFGEVEQWSVGSQCCGEDVVEGKVFLTTYSTHVAKKDHFKNEKLIVAKGQRYESKLVKGYYIEDGIHKPIYKYEKRVIKNVV